MLQPTTYNLFIRRSLGKGGRPIFPLLLSLLLLSGCLGLGGSTTTTSSGSGKVYTGENFTINYPGEWELMDRFGSEYPKETLVAFRSNQTAGAFTANLNVTQIPLAQKVTAEELAAAKMGVHENTLTGFKYFGKEQITIKSGTEDLKTYLYRFEGKKQADADTISFIQLFTVSADKGYIVTASMKSGEKENIVKILETMLKSFRLK